jgi:putative ABC transport system permease protein
MAVIGELWRRLRFLIRGSGFDRDLDEEMRFHLEMKSARTGDRDRARRQFGNLTLLKEVSREMWGWNSLENLVQDLRYATRTMKRSPAFTAIVVATLALGIGANTAIFSIVDHVLLRPLPFPEQDRLVAVYSRFAPVNQERGAFSVADFLDLRAQIKSLDRFSAYTYGRSTLTGVEQPEVIKGAGVTISFFSVLGAKPLLGRTFLEGEDKPKGPRVAVLSENLWRRVFSSDPKIAGRSLILDGVSLTVVGVMPAGFSFPQEGIDLWQLMAFTPPTLRFPFFLQGVARLKPGVTLRQAQSELNAIAPSIERTDPKTYSHLSFPLYPLREGMVGTIRLALLVMLGSVGMVLLIAAVNVANLLLARAAAREREIAIRMSIGASRIRVVRQLLTESLLLALAGGIAGVSLAVWGVRYVRTLSVASIPRVEEVHIDIRVLAFTLLISILSGVLFGLAPALETLRFRMHESLKQNERGGMGSGARRLRNALVMAEIALSFLLLTGAGLLMRSFLKLENVDPGFRPDNLLSASLSPSMKKYPDDAKNNALYRQVEDKLRALPGVESVALTQTLPPNGVGWMEGFRIEGRPLPEGTMNPPVPLATIRPGYFKTLGIPRLQGRDFDDHDLPSSQPVAIISATMARRYFPNQNPIGKRLMMGWSLPNEPWREIVGVVGDTPYRGLDEDPEAVYYLPLSQLTGGSFFVVVRAANAASLASALRSTIWSIDNEIPISNVRTMEQAMSASVAQPRFRTVLIGTFGAVALLLAAIGIYGVVSYAVTQRTREFGIRMALGARHRDVIVSVISSSAVLLLIGLTVGLAASLALTRVLSTLLFQIGPKDPLTFIGASSVLTLIALLASIIPAHRATQIDPVNALRNE